MLVETPRADGPRPRFSLIAACYNVEHFVDEFAASLERQTIGSEDLEIIAVDDGSTDATAERIERSARRSRFRWSVLTQDNAGQGAARNLGLAHAQGDWVTFVDPDDWLDSHYLAVIARFMDEFPEAELVAGARVPMYEQDGGFRRGSHPLDAMFETDALVDLDRYPDYFHGSGPAAFVRASRLAQEDLRFDPMLRPNFEDAHLLARYLLACPAPLVGFVGSARYYYRKRADGSSSTQRSHAHVGRFAVVPRHGMLDVLETAARQKGMIPLWLQNLVLYELSYYFSEAEESGSEPDYVCRGPAADEFMDALAAIAGLLSPDAVRGFRIRRFDPIWRDTLLHSLSGASWRTPYAVVERVGDGDAIVKMRDTGLSSDPIVLSGGSPMAAPGVRSAIELFGQRVLSEYALAVPADREVRVLVDGAQVPLRTDWEPQVVNAMTPASVRRRSALVRLARPSDDPTPAESLRADRRRRFRADFGWRARRKLRHLTPSLRRR